VGVRQAGRERHGGAKLQLRFLALVGLQLGEAVGHEREADAAEAFDVALHARAADLAHRPRLARRVRGGVGRHVLGPQHLERTRHGRRL
jgi:hypothetical protein